MSTKKRVNKLIRSRAPLPQEPADTVAEDDTFDALIAAVRAGTPEEKSARLRRVGLVTADGKLGRRYRDWGSKVTRTSET